MLLLYIEYTTTSHTVQTDPPTHMHPLYSQYRFTILTGDRDRIGTHCFRSDGIIPHCIVLLGMYVGVKLCKAFLKQWISFLRNEFLVAITTATANAGGDSALLLGGTSKVTPKGREFGFGSCSHIVNTIITTRR